MTSNDCQNRKLILDNSSDFLLREECTTEYILTVSALIFFNLPCKFFLGQTSEFDFVHTKVEAESIFRNNCENAQQSAFDFFKRIADIDE